MAANPPSPRSIHLLLLLLSPAWAVGAFAGSWNQWLGGPERTLNSTVNPPPGSTPKFSERWRRAIGSGFAGISVHGTNAITGVTNGKEDAAVLLDAANGTERWRFPIGRTRKRSEGAPPGPLSTPALDAESAYVQALDGRFFCLDLASGKTRWEVNLKRDFKAYEPGYGFANSPLLLADSVVLLPARSRSCSAVALDRSTGKPRWIADLGDSTEYASATALLRGTTPQIVAHLSGKTAGLNPADGSVAWELEGISGSLWTPSVLASGTVFLPAAGESHLIQPGATSANRSWSSPVFESVMGPVVEINGMLIGHHKRKLTAVDAGTGTRLWQLKDESDGQLLALGPFLLFVHDRVGRLEVLAVDKDSPRILARQEVMKPARMETPLAFDADTLYIRAPEELIALRLTWNPQAPPAGKGPDPVSP